MRQDLIRLPYGWPGGAVRLVAIGVLLPLMVACASSRARPAVHPAAVTTPTAIIPAPADLLAATGPAANGVLWVLAGSSNARTLHQIDIVSHADLRAVPAPASATSVAETATGILGLGLATSSTGAVQLRNGTTGALLTTVAVPAPVRAVAGGMTGSDLYVLTGTATAASVSELDTATDRVLTSVPVPLLAAAAVPDPAQSALWVLQPNGLVDQVAMRTGTVTTQFSIGNSGRALAVSPDGSTLYVLKGRGGVRNVAVVDLATESVSRVLPAPSDTVGLVLSPDGGTIYDIVGTAEVGNIQAFRSGAG